MPNVSDGCTATQEVKRQNSEGKYFQPTLSKKKTKKKHLSKSLLRKKGVHQNEDIKEERGKQEIKKSEDLRVSLDYLTDENTRRGNSHICQSVGLNKQREQKMPNK